MDQPRRRPGTARATSGLAAVLLVAACGGGSGAVDDGGARDGAAHDGLGPQRDGGAGADAIFPPGGDAAAPDAGAPGAPDAAPTADAAPIIDLDRDGLDDAREAALAAAYLPYLSLHPDDACPLSAIVFRAHPHARDAALVHIRYVHLFEQDCGLFSGHVGDDEVAAITIDPRIPAPAGILTVKAISHQGTPCERVTECGACAAEPCATADDGGAWPVVYYSRDKHGSYARACGVLDCADECTLAPARARPPMLNVGEPGAHLVEDLTDAGLITLAAGWIEDSLYHYDPWGAANFGSAGNVASDLVDPAFDTCIP